MVIPVSLKGSCLCGAVSYEVTGTPAGFDLDHCSCCRKSSGSAFKAELIFKTAEFRWVCGRPLVKTYEAPVRNMPPGYRRTFCVACGGPLPTVDDDMVNVPAGTLDDDPGLRPQRHIFVDFKASWFEITVCSPASPQNRHELRQERVRRCRQFCCGSPSSVRRSWRKLRAFTVRSPTRKRSAKITTS